MPTLADAKYLDASGPHDPDMTGSKDLLTEKPGEDIPQDEKDFPIQLPDGLTETMVIDWAMRRKKSHESWYATESQAALDAYKMFISLPVGGMTGGSYVPLASSVIETDTAKRMQAMFNKLKVIDSIYMHGPQLVQDEENKQLIDDLINQEILFGTSRLSEKAFDMIKTSGIEGTGFAKTYWDFCEYESIQPQYVADPMSGQPLQVGENRNMAKRGYPNASKVAGGNMIWDKRVGTRIQDSDYVGERSFVTKNELLILQDNGEIAQVDKIAQLETASKDSEIDPETKRRGMLGEGTTTQNSMADNDEGVYKMDEWHALIPYQAPSEDGMKKWTHANLRFRIVNDQTMVQCGENPWKHLKHPYVSFRYSIKPGQMLGNSVIQPIKQLQIDVNNLQTSSTKLIKKAAQNPTFYERASGLDGRKVFIDELALIPVNDASKIKYNPIDGAAIRAVSEERGFLINLARDTVAANDQAQAIQQSGDATATEMNILNQNSGTRFQSVVDLQGWEFFAAIAKNFYFLIREYAQDGELIVRESSEDGNPRPITKMDLVNDYDFVPITSATVSNQAAALQKKMQWAQEMAQQQMQNPLGMKNPDGSYVRFDIPGFTIKEIMPLLGIKNGRTYLVTTSAQEVLAEQQAQAQAQNPPQAGQAQFKPKPSGLAGPAQSQHFPMPQQQGA